MADAHDLLDSIADHPDALTPEWLTAALRADGHLVHDAEVTEAECAPLGTGQMCDSVRITVDYSGAPEDHDSPTTLVAKLPACDETSRSTAVSLRNYLREVNFYRELAPGLAIHTPTVYYADIDDTGGSFVLLMEDMSPAEQGDQLAGCSLEIARAAVLELVGLHAPRWDDPALRGLDWLYGDREAGRESMLALLPMLWAGFVERYDDRLTDDTRTAGTQLFDNLAGYLADTGGPLTITHGDYRLDNLLIHPDTLAITAVDWQTIDVGNAMSDVAYFIGAGLLPDDRRTHEEMLVREYHEALNRALAEQGRSYGWDDAWQAYRRGTWAGLVVAVAASMLVERTERGDDMFMAMSSRHARHALDHAAVDLIT